MPNRLIHAYFDINLDILWQTVSKDLPELAAALKIAMAAVQNDKKEQSTNRF